MTSLPKPVKSPCISVCALDDQDVCTGCQRTAVEITQWGRMSDEQRRDVLRLAHQRAVAQGLMLPSV